MFVRQVIENCAPTLAGLKTGNLFSVKNEDYDILEETKKLNRVLVKRGLRIVPIKKGPKRTLIYLYRPHRLTADLCQEEAVDILAKKGYSTESCASAIVQLAKHITSDDEFPHEIGLFLGYPPSDVKCFMNSPRDGVKCTGCWKAYSNECEAKRVFEKYKACTKTYISQMKKGKSLESLVVDEENYPVAV